mmetsp:Transcript_1373/g.2512  ORF Transcript_1373/g.2512 Transcript_1373/m.2512 type:complete len:84 (-) Transcript_1373:249-500(-)
MGSTEGLQHCLTLVILGRNPCSGFLWCAQQATKFTPQVEHHLAIKGYNFADSQVMCSSQLASMCCLPTLVQLFPWSENDRARL